MASVKCVLLLFVLGMFIHKSIAWNNRLPGESYGMSDPKVQEFGKTMGNHIREHDSNTLWEKRGLSIDKKEGLGYTFNNGAKAAIGGDGLRYEFGAGKKLTVDPVNQEVKYKPNNGAEVYGKRKDDGWEAGVKWDF